MGLFKNIILLLILTVVSLQSFASNSKCEREVAAKVLMLRAVDKGLEKIQVDLAILKETNHKEIAAKVESKNSIYFYTYQLAEQICKNLPYENNELASK